MKRICLAILAVAVILVTNQPGRAAPDPNAPSRQPHAWKWPLYEPARDTSNQLVPGRPRTLLYQSLGDWGDDLHPGIDIGANHDNVVNGEHLPDLTVIPMASRLVRVFDHGDCGSRPIYLGATERGKGGYLCRMWFRTEDEQFLYYFGHVHYNSGSEVGDVEVNSAFRKAVTNTLAQTCGDECKFASGALGPTISDWMGSDSTGKIASYNHLHFTIVDRQDGYDLINPLAYLDARDSVALGQDRRGQRPLCFDFFLDHPAGPVRSGDQFGQ